MVCQTENGHAGREQEARWASARAKVTGRIERLTDMMADGIGDYAENKTRMAAALTVRAEIDRLQEDDEVSPAVALHPNLAESYRRNVETLTEALNAPGLEAGEAWLALRNLIELMTSSRARKGAALTYSCMAGSRRSCT